MTAKSFQDRVLRVSRLSNTRNGDPRFNVRLAVYGWVVTGQDGVAASKIESLVGKRVQVRVHESSPVQRYMIDINLQEVRNGHVRPSARAGAHS